MSGVFDAYSAYYDVLYQDKDYPGETSYVDAMIQRWKPGAGSLLELGSGTGKHALHFRDLGYETHGFEVSKSMMEEASARLNDPAAFTLGDIRDARIGQRFDVALSLFHVISYLPEDADVRAAFETARSHLNPGGLLMFDVWYGPAVLAQRPEPRVKEMEDDRYRVVRSCVPTMTPSENRVDVHYDVKVVEKASGDEKEVSEDHPMRYFDLEELDAFLADTGFKRLHAEEWMTRHQPSSDTWGVVVVAELTGDSER